MPSSNMLGPEVGYISQNGNGTEIEVVAYLDCFHELTFITFIVFIKSNHLAGASAHYSYIIAYTILILDCS